MAKLVTMTLDYIEERHNSRFATWHHNWEGLYMWSLEEHLEESSHWHLNYNVYVSSPVMTIETTKLHDSQLLARWDSLWSLPPMTQNPVCGGAGSVGCKLGYLGLVTYTVHTHTHTHTHSSVHIILTNIHLVPDSQGFSISFLLTR